MKQLNLLKNENKAYGGELLKTRKGRQRGRPLDTKNTMHLVLRSSKAIGKWSFTRKENDGKIQRILAKFSVRYGVRILSIGNAGNHIHIHIKLANRQTYRPFIRAITGAIAMAITGASRWRSARGQSGQRKLKFWDYRPYTRVVQSFAGLLKLKDYIRINQLEGFGYSRAEARYIDARRFEARWSPPPDKW